ncbi:DUF177 domain-containing protein [Rhodohalobacter sp. SW132]|nr:DUF177 domain-containing protein [Rhodohalobacter sp. SW132]REL33672.1 DUF177 domain-containing protein [Rhodohalobacter sp. SW132]
MAIVDKQKLRFDIQELPEGESSKERSLTKGFFELDEEISFLEGEVHINFFRTDHFIKVSFSLQCSVELICDRSLEPFEKKIEGKFDILFQPGEIEESVTAESAVKQIPADELVLDISDEVRDTIMLNIPIKKIHPKYVDESGKLNEFETAQFGDLGEDDEQAIDPRWEKLKKLKNK